MRMVVPNRFVLLSRLLVMGYFWTITRVSFVGCTENDSMDELLLKMSLKNDPVYFYIHPNVARLF